MSFENDYTFRKDTKMKLQIYSTSQRYTNIQFAICLHAYVCYCAIYNFLRVSYLSISILIILILKLWNTR